MKLIKHYCKKINIIYLVTMCIISYLMYLVFYKQTFLEGYDLCTYAYTTIRDADKYFINTYPIMFDTAKLIYRIVGNSNVALALTVTIYNSITIIIVHIIFSDLTKKNNLSTMMAFSMVFVSMLYASHTDVLGIGYRYLGVWSPNPWHSGTYIAAKPFMVIAFMLGAKTLSVYELELNDICRKKYDYKKYLALAVSMLLVTLAKPNYTLIHGFVICIVLIVNMIKKRFSNIKATALLGLYYLPTLLLLIKQHYMVYGDGVKSVGSNYSESGIGVEFLRGWKFCDNVPLAIFLAAAFPITVLAVHWQDLKKSRLYLLSWEIFCTGLLMVLFLYEKGITEDHCNFFWGYMSGLFIIFFSSMVMIINDWDYLFDKGVKSRIKVMVALEWLMFFLHLGKGIEYFFLILMGNSTN